MPTPRPHYWQCLKGVLLRIFGTQGFAASGLKPCLPFSFLVCAFPAGASANIKAATIAIEHIFVIVSLQGGCKGTLGSLLRLNTMRSLIPCQWPCVFPYLGLLGCTFRCKLKRAGGGLLLSSKKCLVRALARHFLHHLHVD